MQRRTGCNQNHVVSRAASKVRDFQVLQRFRVCPAEVAEREGISPGWCRSSENTVLGTFSQTRSVSAGCIKVQLRIRL